jgi:hypothetical protein
MCHIRRLLVIGATAVLRLARSGNGTRSADFIRASGYHAAKQAGHMTAPDQFAGTSQKPLPSGGRAHMAFLDQAL